MKFLTFIATTFFIVTAGSYSLGQTLNNPKVPASFAQQFNFNQELEFPNLFLPKAYRHQAPETIPAEVIQTSRALLEKAVSSVLHRTVWHLTLPQETEIKSLNLLAYLNHTAKNIDSNAKVYPSSETLNAVLSYTYQALYEAQLHGKTDPAEVLKNIINSHESISAKDILGVGGRFDVLLDGASADKIQPLTKSLSAIINNDFTTVFIDSKAPAAYLKYGGSVFMQGQVIDYSQHMQKNSVLGGDSLTSLTYDLDAGTFKNPPHESTATDQFIRGSLNYSAPDSVTTSPRVFHSLGVLLELPFLKIKQIDTLKNDITEVITALESNPNLPNQDLTEIEKIAGKSIYGGAHNRFWRGSANSLEQQVNLLNRALVKHHHVSLPIFVETEKHIGNVGDHDFPKELLMDKKEFFEYHTDQGRLYHGTPRLENVWSILKNGLRVSDDHTGNGRSIKGRGAYLTGIKYVAMEYMGVGVPPLEFTVVDSPDLRVVDWKKISSSTYIQNLNKWCREANVDIFEYLARVHHIDIIIYDHVLIQNSTVLDLSRSSQEVAESFMNAERKSFLEMSEQDHEFDETFFQILRQMGRELGQEKTILEVANHPLRKPLEHTTAPLCEKVFTL